MAECVLVSFESAKNGDNAVLLVGKYVVEDNIEIINAFSDNEATELWNKIINKEEKDNGNS